ncbi:MAG: hypothetical protein FWC95_02870 [Defluviitaleaceae bacterium]|nr:hypothetical protein [Defluviitaleaceae bacterium]
MKKLIAFILILLISLPVMHSYAAPLLWRKTLTAHEQILYDRILRTANNLGSRVLVGGLVGASRILNVLEAVRMDNPAVFWLSYSAEISFIDQNRVLFMFPTYIEDEETLTAMWFEFTGNTEYVINIAKQEKNITEQARLVFIHIMETTEFDRYAHFHQSAFSAVASAYSVCMGKSLAFLHFCQILGIPAAVVFGTIGGYLHAWNVLLINGNLYHADATWGYFMKTDEELRAAFANLHITPESEAVINRLLLLVDN